MVTAHCDFCNEFSGKPVNTFDRIYHGDPKSRVLFRSDDFVVIPSLGQIVEGYLLIVPAEHWTALGDLPDSHVEELALTCERVKAVHRKEYASCIFFEHGTRSASAGGCGIYHSHLHIVPCTEVLDPVGFLTSKFPYSEIGGLSELKRQTASLPGYLFYQDSKERSYVFDASNLPSQYLRKLLAHMLGEHDWDWRMAGREERLLSTLNRLSNGFDAFSDLLRVARDSA